MKVRKNARFKTPEEVCAALLSGELPERYAITRASPSTKNREEYKAIYRQGIHLYRIEKLKKKLEKLEQGDD